ncbi:Hypothetical_protein [Hexamita inflata]|uniref:Hypothetical_protein n=1 Tax=Hexamita inflata TaxID=28002 RepID=A0AA86RCF6_9EUKA|nr:Hypothetical protein HINF_LOCUS59713 [Hexamita inflata]
MSFAKTADYNILKQIKERTIWPELQKSQKPKQITPQTKNSQIRAKTPTEGDVTLKRSGFGYELNFTQSLEELKLTTTIRSKSRNIIRRSLISEKLTPLARQPIDITELSSVSQYKKEVKTPVYVSRNVEIVPFKPVLNIRKVPEKESVQLLEQYKEEAMREAAAFLDDFKPIIEHQESLHNPDIQQFYIRRQLEQEKITMSREAQSCFEIAEVINFIDKQARQITLKHVHRQYQTVDMNYLKAQLKEQQLLTEQLERQQEEINAEVQQKQQQMSQPLVTNTIKNTPIQHNIQPSASFEPVNLTEVEQKLNVLVQKLLKTQQQAVDLDPFQRFQPLNLNKIQQQTAQMQKTMKNPLMEQFAIVSEIDELVNQTIHKCPSSKNKMETAKQDIQILIFDPDKDKQIINQIKNKYAQEANERIAELEEVAQTHENQEELKTIQQMLEIEKKFAALNMQCTEFQQLVDVQNQLVQEKAKMI